MIYSYTQISQYLRCPRSYRYRYLDGWREKDTRAAMVFGRCFEKALGAYFEQRGLDRGAIQGMAQPSVTLRLNIAKGRILGPALHQGVHLLEKFARDDRVRITTPERESAT